MRPSPAEIVRTLVAGRLPALAHLAHRPGPHHVRHVTDPEGRVLLLVPVVSDLAAALRPADGEADVALVLDVLDLPPAAGAPSLGRAWVSGWAARLDGDEARRAALDFAAAEPTGDLLDVGTRFHLFRFEVVEARWERADSVRRIDPGAYAEAEPDPLHPVEAELLADLADHHADQVAGYLRRQLGLADDNPGGPPRVVRIDRYGMVVAYGRPGARRRARLAFPQPVSDHAELARLLHPMLCRHAGASERSR
ncbi:Protein of unknown function [Micromonospora rhizosphaerae]|uniref:DUF2470 domain-containing protein n=1 Tax=Micromonospora rhizosphaerae TaxID=568872 RepID=A0A1C6T6R6_9ACTN|nr:DUF2470 domain-containing protein [Micromonospora rhizosphaerae]SCL37349.1 Protein of unknown function [Micromonospora rhizosphaerae]